MPHSTKNVVPFEVVTMVLFDAGQVTTVGVGNAEETELEDTALEVLAADDDESTTTGELTTADEETATLEELMITAEELAAADDVDEAAADEALEELTLTGPMYLAPQTPEFEFASPSWFFM